MGEENWPENVVRSVRPKSYINRPRNSPLELEEVLTDGYYYKDELGEIVYDGPRLLICADCGKVPDDGAVFHVKPEVYAIKYKGEVFYLERHIGVACGCAKKRGLV